MIRAALLCLLLLQTLPARGAELLPSELEKVKIVEHLGDQLPGDLAFVDQDGRDVRLSDYWSDGKPVLLTLNYFGCTMLCTLQLNELVQSMKEAGLHPGEGFRMVTVSFDARDETDIASAKRAGYLKQLGDPKADWSFLTGSQESIDALTEAAGFGYTYLPDTGEFAHAAVTYLVSPQGKLTRYIYGLTFPSRDLRFALIEAAEGTVGTITERLILTCFHYDPQEGRYTPFAFGFLRLGGLATLLGLGSLLGAMWTRERFRRPSAGGEACS